MRNTHFKAVEVLRGVSRLRRLPRGELPGWSPGTNVFGGPQATMSPGPRDSPSLAGRRPLSPPGRPLLWPPRALGQSGDARVIKTASRNNFRGRSARPEE